MDYIVVFFFQPFHLSRRVVFGKAVCEVLYFNHFLVWLAFEWADYCAQWGSTVWHYAYMYHSSLIPHGEHVFLYGGTAANYCHIKYQGFTSIFILVAFVTMQENTCASHWDVDLIWIHLQLQECSAYCRCWYSIMLLNITGMNVYL